jgi:hypothetical protein
LEKRCIHFSRRSKQIGAKKNPLFSDKLKILTFLGFFPFATTDHASTPFPSFFFFQSCCMPNEKHFLPKKVFIRHDLVRREREREMIKNSIEAGVRRSGHAKRLILTSTWITT